MNFSSVLILYIDVKHVSQTQLPINTPDSVIAVENEQNSEFLTFFGIKSGVQNFLEFRNLTNWDNLWKYL